MGPASAVFEAHNGLDYGGVLFLLPALLMQGLLTIKETHKLKAGYYDINAIILTLAFMALCRIKNPEQLKQYKPGELGRLIGLDRVPELKCLRKKISELASQDQGKELNDKLLQYWMPQDEGDVFLYADGHVNVYNGYLANLPVKYISRQKLCMSATTGFWLNDQQGNPLLVVSGELSEKLQHAIENNLITRLIKSKAVNIPQDITGETPAVCTIVFDREAYQPAFFMRLWTQYRIAVITYRKNVKDKWEEETFKNQSVTIGSNKKTMQLCEQSTHLDTHLFREIRCLTNTGHQTAIITTHPLLPATTVAGAMFTRWTQENFFKYMISDYSFDHIISYGTEDIDAKKEVVNPQYRKKTCQIKKEKEKKQRLQASFMEKMEKNLHNPLDTIAAVYDEQSNLVESIEAKQQYIDELTETRKTIDAKIKLSEMTDEKRYNKLKTESSLFINIIKMICYRAETALANQIHFYNRADDEKRMLIKQIIQTPVNIIPDYHNKTLTVILHTLSTPRYNEIANTIATLLNETETIFPGTELTLIFKTQ
ncbi:MAG: putative transposase [Ferruginibacter sp.]